MCPAVSLQSPVSEKLKGAELLIKSQRRALGAWRGHPDRHAGARGCGEGARRSPPNVNPWVRESTATAAVLILLSADPAQARVRSRGLCSRGGALTGACPANSGKRGLLEAEEKRNYKSQRMKVKGIQ